MKVQKVSRGAVLNFNLGDWRGCWSTPRPGRFTSGKETRYPFYKTLGRTQGRSGRVRESPHNPGFDPQTGQPVANRYRGFANLAYGDELRIKLTLWSVRVTTVAVQKQYVLHILSVCLYPWLSRKQCGCAVLLLSHRILPKLYHKRNYFRKSVI